mgnify:CR=1 FL=1
MKLSAKVSRLQPDARAMAAAVACLLMIALAPGCSPYQLQVKVIEGTNGYATHVGPDDHQLDDDQTPGLSGVKVQLTIDPQSISPKHVGEFMTDGNGRFTAPVRELGAGILQYELGILSQTSGYKSVFQNMALPAKERQLLIVMAPGKDTRPPPSDFLKETQAVGEQLLRGN